MLASQANAQLCVRVNSVYPCSSKDSRVAVRAGIRDAQKRNLLQTAASGLSSAVSGAQVEEQRLGESSSLGTTA